MVQYVPVIASKGAKTAEVMKQVDWLAETCRHYYRDKDQDEVDIIVEGEGGAVVGIEVKAAATVTAGDFKGLRRLSAPAARTSSWCRSLRR
jgi:predicted AAA+ superfamily ATPase